MGIYLEYQCARNIAWQTLLRYELYSFPIDVFGLCGRMGYEVKQVEELPEGAHSVSFRHEEATYIAYVPSGNEYRDRFTIAHEVGHILRGHLNGGRAAADFEEEQANVFASRLLAPLVVLRHHGFSTVGEVSAFFGISETAAENRMKRLIEVAPRGKFLSHPSEREYYDNYCRINGYNRRIRHTR